MAPPLQRFIYAILGIVALAAMDLSSYCHPVSEAPNMPLIAKARAAEVVPPFATTEADNAPVDYRELTWAERADVGFQDDYLEARDSDYWKPVFGEQVLAAESEDVYVTGYVIPVDLDEDFYVLSRYPFANCFFCGGAGPESVVDLRFADSDHRTYQTDERLTFHGNLRLNADDVYQMNYILEGAEEHPL